MTNIAENIPFYAFLDFEEKEKIEKSVQKISFSRSRIVNSDGNCTGFISLLSGQLKVYSLSPEGREITLFRFFPSSLCIFTATCLLKDIDFDVSIVAEEDSQCLLIPASVMDWIRRRNIKVSNYLGSVISSHLSDLMWLIDQILNKRLDSRVAAYLEEEADLRGETVLRLTHEEVARHLGSRREVISRTLSYMEKEGLVRVRRGEVEIDALHFPRGEHVPDLPRVHTDETDICQFVELVRIKLLHRAKEHA